MIAPRDQVQDRS